MQKNSSQTPSHHLLTNSIINQVDSYLKKSDKLYLPSQLEYGARLALSQAREAYLSGNYGVGAALFVLKPKLTEIFFGRNRIVTGTPLERFNTHAETDAIKNWLNSIEHNKTPDLSLKIDSSFLGIRLFVNLEPCPKCEMEITMLLSLATQYVHPRASIECISLSTDGVTNTYSGVSCGTGSAHALGKKHLTSPLVWRSIQRGYFPNQKPVKQPPIRFFLLSTSPLSLEGKAYYDAYVPTKDKELVKLGWKIFTKTRTKIDQILAQGKI